MGAIGAKIQLLALWMSMLVITIPIVTAANTVNVQQISGQDGINGIRRVEDTVQITALLSIQDGDAAALPGALTVSDGAGSVPFTSCNTAVSGSAVCQFTTAPNTRTTPITYFLQLFGDTPELAASTAARLEVDSVGPRITAIRSGVDTASSGSIPITFTATDCASGSCTRCAGVDRVELYLAETGAKVQDFNIEGSCTVTETRNVPVTALPNGLLHLCAVPVDTFGQVRQELRGSGSVPIGGNCIEITKDSTVPQISAFGLTYQGSNVPVDFLSETGTTIAVKATVRTNLFALADNQIRVDLTQLGLAAITIPCIERFTHEYQCEAEIRAASATQGAKTISVQAVDEFGNTATQSFSANIGMDSTAPTVASFRTGFSVQRNNATVSVLGRRNNTFIAEFVESGSGFDMGNVRVAVAGTTLPMNCSGVRCQSAPYQVSGSPTSLSATLSGADDVGHTFSVTKSFAVDVQPPVLRELTVMNSNKLPYIVEGDDLIITAVLDDASGIAADRTSANFRNISASANPNPTCTQSTTGSTCRWTLLDVFPANQVIGEFRFVDTADNPLVSRIGEFPLVFEQGGRTVTLPAGIISIAKNANASSADFWRPNPQGPMPAFIDDDTARVVPYRAWWDIGFEPQGNINMRIVDVDFNPQACEGADFDSYVQEMDILFPDPTQMDKFFVKVTFKRGGIDKELLQFDCPVRTRTIYNNQIYPAEVDDVLFRIPVTNAGEISDGVKEEIDRVKNSWLVKADWIGKIAKWMQLGKNICNIIASVTSLFKVFENWQIANGPAIDANIVTKPVGVAVSGAKDASHEGFKKIHKVVDKFCKWMSCETGINKWYGKFINSVDLGKASEKLPAGGGRRAGQPSKASATLWPADPSQSLILSLVALCIPGIFFNLQKARQIECQYLACLHDQVKSGTPVFVCSKLRNYGWCRYVMGEIFQLIPFASFFQSFAGVVQQLLANPISAFLGISSWFCTQWVGISTAKHGFCHQINNVKMLGDALNDLSAIAKMDWKVKDSCEEILNRIDEADGGDTATATSAAAQQSPTDATEVGA